MGGTSYIITAILALCEPTVVLDIRSFWRCHLSFRDPVVGDRHEFKLKPMGKDALHWNSRFPPYNWMKPDFDDGSWWCAPGPFYGGYGFQQPDTIALICLRGKFVVDDPSKIKSVTFSAAYRGGLVVYLNGREVVRGHLAYHKKRRNRNRRCRRAGKL